MPATRAVALMISAWALICFGAAPASASCATDSSEPSPYAFVGTVTDTSEGGRVAEVVTDDGVTVTVLGTQDTSWSSSSYTSADRRYAEGGRYEFHPLNGESPYTDNACTATRQLSGPALPASPETGREDDVFPAWLPIDEQAGPIGYLLFFGPLAVAAVGLVALVRGLSRRSAPVTKQSQG